jgi:putative transposase
MSHVSGEIYLHINWHTKRNAPILQGLMEERAQAAIRDRCRQARGVLLHEIGGTDDHVHIVLEIEPNNNASLLVGQLKGGSSHDVNAQTQANGLHWQRGFGIKSFAEKGLPWVVDYIRRQREHHAKGTTIPKLEECGDEEDEDETKNKEYPQGNEPEPPEG